MGGALVDAEGVVAITDWLGELEAPARSGAE
jgi:hypothetical protein